MHWIYNRTHDASSDEFKGLMMRIPGRSKNGIRQILVVTSQHSGWGVDLHNYHFFKTCQEGLWLPSHFFCPFPFPSSGKNTDCD